MCCQFFWNDRMNWPRKKKGGGRENTYPAYWQAYATHCVMTNTAVITTLLTLVCPTRQLQSTVIGTITF